MCVWHFIDSAPGHNTDLKPVSSEPVWHGGGHRVKNFCEKWPVAKLPLEKCQQCFPMGEDLFWLTQRYSGYKSIIFCRSLKDQIWTARSNFLYDWVKT
jgi:hypothetical protein